MEGVCKELQEKAIAQDSLNRLDEIFQIPKAAEVLDQLANRLQGNGRAGLGQMRELLDLLPAAGFDARGSWFPAWPRVEIYTGTVFECFLVESTEDCLFTGGGRKI